MAEPTFKAVPYSKLSAEDKSVIDANAKSQGITPEQYLESRGGVNRAGYYGDSYREGITLTDAEYSAAIESAKASGVTGVGLGDAINRASAKKAYDAAIASGADPVKAKADYDAALAGTAGMLKGYGYKGPTYTGSASISGNTTDSSGTAVTQTGFGPGTKGYTDRKSAYDLLYSQFAEYGLEGLVTPLKGLIESNISPSEFTLRLRDTDAYKKRFAANAQRVAKGLRALSEAEYIGLEDQYQNVMRNYGLPESYYTKGDMGVQQGFEKFIAGDVSAAELEDRIQTAQNRVLYANPEVSTALKQFYPDITNGDILAYALDPQQALTNIKRKVTAAEIGAGALVAGLQTDLAKAEALRGYGVTGEQAKQGYQTIAGVLPRASTLADIYSKQGMGPYTQTTAEAEVFGLPAAAEATIKRKKLTELEQAQFGGSAGRAQGALARERAGQF